MKDLTVKVRYKCQDCWAELSKDQVSILSRCPKCGGYSYIKIQQK